jgi:hypothetical protein
MKKRKMFLTGATQEALERGKTKAYRPSAEIIEPTKSFPEPSESGQVEATRMGIECARALFDGQLKSSEPVMDAEHAEKLREAYAIQRKRAQDFKALLEKSDIERDDLAIAMDKLAGRCMKAESEAKALRERDVLLSKQYEELKQYVDPYEILIIKNHYLARAALASAPERT